MANKKEKLSFEELEKLEAEKKNDLVNVNAENFCVNR